MKRFLALLLTGSILALTLCGCLSFDVLDRLNQRKITPFSEMEYTRPDPEAVVGKMEAVAKAAATERSVNALMDLVYEGYELYYDFYTAYALANIHYSADLTQEKWQEEYNFCTGAATQVDAALDRMLYALADSPLKGDLEAEEFFGAGFFDGYEGESVWDEEFTALMTRESELQNQYYALSAAAAESENYEAYYNEIAPKMAELLVDLVELRQQIARCAGYPSFQAFAYDFYFQRDYSPEQEANLLEQIRLELAPLYREMADSEEWMTLARACNEKSTMDYVEELANAAGGTIQEAFNVMKAGTLYDIAPSKNKYDASFTIYLLNYDEPYILVNPSGMKRDQLTFTHEFGHFCNAYASYGGQNSTDVSEIFSQGLEYLSLCYTASGKKLEQAKALDALSVYVEQAAYAAFEQKIYALEGKSLSREGVCKAFEETVTEFGLDIWDISPLDFVNVTHFYTNPVYIVSYVVSNDAAFQIYQLERAEKGKGLALYQDGLTSEEGYFLAFLNAAGLESPFTSGRIHAVRETLEEILK